MYIAEREQGRIKNEMSRLTLQQEDIKDRMNSYENAIYNTNKKSEDLRTKMNWDKEVWLYSYSCSCCVECNV